MLLSHSVSAGAYASESHHHANVYIYFTLISYNGASSSCPLQVRPLIQTLPFLWFPTPPVHQVDIHQLFQYWAGPEVDDRGTSMQWTDTEANNQAFTQAHIWGITNMHAHMRAHMHTYLRIVQVMLQSWHNGQPPLGHLLIHVVQILEEVLLWNSTNRQRLSYDIRVFGCVYTWHAALDHVHVQCCLTKEKSHGHNLQQVLCTTSWLQLMNITIAYLQNLLEHRSTDSPSTHDIRNTKSCTHKHNLQSKTLPTPQLLHTICMT